MDWGGINLLVEDSDINKNQSPDLANCFFYGDKKGLLGPRKGFTAVNSKAFPSNVAGIIPFKNIRLIATSDGEIVPDQAISQYLAIGTSTIEDGLGGGGSNQLSVSYPNLTGTATFTLPTPVDLSGSYMTKFHPGHLAFNVWSPGVSTTSITVTFQVYLVIDGSDVLIGHWIFNSAISVYGGVGPSVLPYYGPSGLDFMLAFHKSSGSLTGVKSTITLSAWPPGATTGDTFTNQGPEANGSFI